MRGAGEWQLEEQRRRAAVGRSARTHEEKLAGQKDDPACGADLGILNRCLFVEPCW